MVFVSVAYVSDVYQSRTGPPNLF